MRTRHIFLAIIATAIAMMYTIPPVSADDGKFVHVQTTLNPDPFPQNGFYELFGWALAEHSGSVIVGNHEESNQVRRSGAAYLYDGQCGGLIRTFDNPTPEVEDHFGFAAVSVGANVLIGAPNDGTVGQQAGAAYLFAPQTGGIIRTFLNPNPDNLGRFGAALASDQNLVVVGAPSTQVGGINAVGEAYLFNANTGALLHTFQNPSSSPGADRFGFAVAISEGKVIVGAPAFTTPRGAAYIFDTETGSLLQTLANPVPGLIDAFGEAVAIAGDDILIGSPFSHVNGIINAGDVHHFNATTGSLVRSITAPQPDEHADFGQSVAFFGDQFVIGAPSVDSDSTGGIAGHLEPGKVFVFDDQGQLLDTFSSPSPNNGDRFGWRLATTNSGILTSAIGHQINGDSSGAIFKFAQTAPPVIFPTDRPTIAWVGSGTAVKRYDGQTGEYIDDFTSGGGPINPADFDFRGDFLYVGDKSTNRVARFDVETGIYVDDFVTPGSGGLNGPSGLRIGVDGHLYVSSIWTHQVKRYDGVTGAYLGDFAEGNGLVRPTWLYFGVDGLYVSSALSDEVKLYDEDTGQFIENVVIGGAGGLDSPLGLVVQTDGYLYVTSSGTNEVKRYDDDTGQFVDNIVTGCSGGLETPHDLQLSRNHIYVTSFSTDEVKRYDRATGRFLDNFISAGSGGLNGPRALRIRLAPDPDPEVDRLTWQVAIVIVLPIIFVLAIFSYFAYYFKIWTVFIPFIPWYRSEE